ncbi:MAG: hypothetical protein IPJ16_10070 [Bacteroidales bacterium]|nr:hypothetical protein [Bacteroidales bacterium]
MKLINPLLILRILSSILMIETISFLLCLPIVYLYDEPGTPFYWSAAITFLISTVFYIVSSKADIDRFTNRDGYLVVTIAWILFSSAGSLPYLLSGTIPNFINAFLNQHQGLQLQDPQY